MAFLSIAILVGSILLGLVILFTVLAVVMRLVSAKGQARSQEVLQRFAPGSVRLVSEDANCFGVQSGGMGQVRGNGCLLLTDSELFFEMWVPQKEIRIPRQSISSVERVRSFLGKSKGVQLLKVNFQSPTGGQDAAAWYVRDLETWVSTLSTS